MGKKKTKSCVGCGTEIPYRVKICPNCGARNKRPFYNNPCFVVLFIIVMLFLIFSPSSSKPDRDTVDPAATVAATAATSQEAIMLDRDIYHWVLTSASETDSAATQVQQQGVTLLDIYNKAKSVKDAQYVLYDKMAHIDTKENQTKFGDAFKSYITEAENFILYGQMYVENLMKYANKSEVKYASSAQDALSHLSDETVTLQDARESFLSQSGLTSDQVTQALSGNL